MTPHESPARRSIRANTGWHAGSGPVCRPVTSGDLGALRITSNLTRPNRDRAAALLADVRRAAPTPEPPSIPILLPFEADSFDEVDGDESKLQAVIEDIRRVLNERVGR